MNATTQRPTPPARYEWWQTIRIGTVTTTMTAMMTQDEAWHWLSATATFWREDGWTDYAVRVEMLA